MNKIMLITLFTLNGILGGACKKENTNNAGAYGNGPKTEVPSTLQGKWMYGYFSMTEYWSQNPSEYIGNGFEMAMAFTFNSNGTYEQYFTSRTATGGVSTYHQSFTRGTVEINTVDKTITTHAATAHYKQTKNGQTMENRDLSKNEITQTIVYTYETGNEPNGTPAIYLKMNGTGNALAFLKL